MSDANLSEMDFEEAREALVMNLDEVLAGGFDEKLLSDEAKELLHDYEVEMDAFMETQGEEGTAAQTFPSDTLVRRYIRMGGILR